MDGHQLGAVGEGPFHLDLLDHLRNPLHDIVAGQDLPPKRHQVGDRPSVADPFENLRGDQRHRFRIVELEATPLPFFRQLGGQIDKELFLFPRGQMQDSSLRSILKIGRDKGLQMD